VRDKPPQDQSPLVIGYQWVGRIMTVVLEMVIPGAIGLGLDNWLGTKVIFTLPGFALGVTLAVWQLVRMTSPAKSRNDQRTADEKRGNRES